MDSKQVYKARFIEIFKWLSRDEFMEDPARILSLMMDFGFERRQVGLLKLVLAQDPKGFRGFFESSPGSEDETIDAIADYCLISRDALSEIMHSMKDAMSMDDVLTIIGEHRGEKCLVSDDVPTTIGEHRGEKCLVSDNGIAKYSLDLKTLLKVKDVSSFCAPDSVTSIGDAAFRGCSSLVKVILPEYLTSIGAYAFWGCFSLKEIVIPDSVTTIGDCAFIGCSSLKEIVIPDSVTTIGNLSFSGCSSLKVIEVPRCLKCKFKGIESDVKIIRR